MEYLNHLNEEQKNAVLYNNGPLMILAAAGSGKTRVITYKIFHLIKHHAIKPSEILALTFTNKAATEMKFRLVEMIGKSAKRIVASTFHSFAVKVLRKEHESINFKENFSIYTDTDKITALRSILKELNISEEMYNPKNIISLFSIYKNSYYNYPMENEELKKVYKKFQEYMISHNAMDFDDLLINLYELLRDNKQIKNKYQNKFKFILVDEYQDTNLLQYKIIKILSEINQNITCCGDDDQGIYSFRGATIENVFSFEKDFNNCKTIVLNYNYRSTKTIIDASSALIKNNEKRKNKNFKTINGIGEKIIISESKDPESEAKFVYDNIMKNLYKDGIQYKDIAILYRSNHQSRPIEELLRFKEVPYKIWGGYNFYEREEIKDILSYFMFLFNPFHEVSLLRIINKPRRKIGVTLIKKLTEYSKKTGYRIFEILQMTETVNQIEGFKEKEIYKLYEFYKLYLRFNPKLFKRKNVGNTLRELLEYLNYKDYLVSQFGEQGAERKWRNVSSLITSIYNYESSEKATVYDVMSRLLFLSQSNDNDDEDDNNVNLLTMHSSKGLEFRVVLLVGVEENVIPSIKSLEDSNDEEERRIFYVAMTRAKEKLLISYCNERKRYGKTIKSYPSRFIDELPEDLINFDTEVHSDKVDASDFTRLKNLLKGK